MPPPYVRTLGDELFYEYAKLISRSAHGSIEYGFVTNRFKALCSGAITMSGTIREWELETSTIKACAFCGATEHLQRDHLIPVSRGGPDDADNLMWTCATCNQSRGNKGVFEWMGLKKKDEMPRLVAGKYLKLLLDWHGQAGTLCVDKKGIATLCARCRLPKVCEEWGSVRKLTCFCMESIF
jgi:hypothetical protein